MLTVLLSFTFANFAKVMLYASEPDSYETNVKVGDRVINFSEGIPQYDGQKELLAIPTENKLKEAGAETNVVRKIAVIKLIYDPAVNPCPLVQVKVGDSEPLLLVVDTGSSEVDLYPWAVNKLRLAEQPGVTQSKVRINGKSGNSLIFSSPLK